MEPTLQNGNALLLKKWGVPQKGDIVTAYIDELDYTVVKRILAAEGDTVNIDERGINRYAQLFHAIITLTEEQKKVILLRIFYEKTFREIGRILEMSEKKAENTYYNALKKMRKLLRGDKYGI